MLPITIEVPAGTPVRVLAPPDDELTKSAAYREKVGSAGTVTLKKGQALKLYETREADGREFRSDIVVLRGV